MRCTEGDINPYQQALSYAEEVFGSVEDTFGCKLDELHKLDATTLAIEALDGVETILDEPNKIYHRITDRAANYLYFAAMEWPDA